MIARVAGENLCPSSASHSSGDRYLSFSIIIVVVPLPTPPVRNILDYLYTHVFYRK